MPFLGLWHKAGGPTAPVLWPRYPSGRIFQRLRKRVKGNPDLLPKLESRPRGPLQSSKEVVLGQIKGAQSREHTCDSLVTPKDLAEPMDNV